MKRALYIALCLFLAFAWGAWAQDEGSTDTSTSTDSSTTDVEHEETQVEEEYVQSWFITAQFGGGSMILAGAGLAFFNNIVRIEGLVGYTPEGAYKDFSFCLRLSARMVEFKLSDNFLVNAAIGSSYTFFSNSLVITGALTFSEEIEMRNILLPSISLYFEQDIYFVQNVEGNFLFQLGIGLRANLQ
jgi:hypothetical protein